MYVYVGDTYPCSNNEMACENGGLCEIHEGLPFCMCQNGYEGKKCQFTKGTLDESLSSNATGNWPNPATSMLITLTILLVPFYY